MQIIPGACTPGDQEGLVMPAWWVGGGEENWAADIDACAVPDV